MTFDPDFMQMKCLIRSSLYWNRMSGFLCFDLKGETYIICNHFHMREAALKGVFFMNVFEAKKRLFSQLQSYPK